MPHTQTLDAVVLRTIDVGEADRFCILFTEQRGKIAARARAVRKIGSRMGGSLLPMQHVSVDVSEHSNGFFVTGVMQSENAYREAGSFHSFLEHARGIDLLLALIEDDHPLPSVFHLLCAFLQHSPDQHTGLLVCYQARLLHLLGLLPAFEDDVRIHALPTLVQHFLQAVLSPLPFASLVAFTPDDPALALFLEGLIQEHTVRPMKSNSFESLVR